MEKPTKAVKPAAIQYVIDIIQYDTSQYLISYHVVTFYHHQGSHGHGKSLNLKFGFHAWKSHGISDFYLISFESVVDK